MRGFVLTIFSVLIVIFLGHALYYIPIPGQEASFMPNLQEIIHLMKAHSFDIEHIIEPWSPIINLYRRMSESYDEIASKYFGPYVDTPLLAFSGDNLLEFIWFYVKFFAEVMIKNILRILAMILISVFSFSLSSITLLFETAQFVGGISKIFLGVTI